MLKTNTAVQRRAFKKFVHCGQSARNLMNYPHEMIKTGARFYPQAL
jgi:hypothetical protein